MDESIKRMAEGLHRAIQAEVVGQHFYLMAARTTSDDQGCEVVEQLADWEAGHHQILLR